MATQKSKDTMKGMVAIFCGQVLYSVMSLLIQCTMKWYSVSPFENTYYQNIVFTLCFYGSTKAYRKDLMSEDSLPPARYLDMFYRVLTGFLSDIILYIAYAYTSQSKAICIFFSLSLMVPAMGFVILKEKINKGDIIGILLGFGGMLLIIQPWKKIESTE